MNQTTCKTESYKVTLQAINTKFLITIVFFKFFTYIFYSTALDLYAFEMSSD